MFYALSQHTLKSMKFKAAHAVRLSGFVSVAVIVTGCQSPTYDATNAPQNTPKKSLTAEQQQVLDLEAKQTIKPFATELLGTVKSAVAAGGHEQAIAACQSLAPAITAKHSGKTGNSDSSTDWIISRTSSKVRNPANAPDAWEVKVLADFAKRAAAGEPLQSMDYGEQVGGQYRYAKAIGMKKPCLACHGDNIKPEVSAMLQKAYPQDAATGYKLGELRGMFSLQKQLDLN